MIKLCRRISIHALLWLLGFANLLLNCAAPIEVKNASRTQLELIDSVDDAVAELQTALDQFHRDMETSIIEEGRMEIARQAIDVTINKDSADVTADALFDIYTKQIQRWVDYAFDAYEDSIMSLEKKIVEIDEKINEEQNPENKENLILNRISLNLDLDDLQLLQAKLKQKPQLVDTLEMIIREDLKKAGDTGDQTRQALQILRAQVALMKVMQEKVDAWITLDVTVTQEQADALKDAFNAANQTLKAGGQ